MAAVRRQQESMHNQALDLEPWLRHSPFQNRSNIFPYEKSDKDDKGSDSNQARRVVQRHVLHFYALQSLLQKSIRMKHGFTGSAVMSMAFQGGSMRAPSQHHLREAAQSSVCPKSCPF